MGMESKHPARVKFHRKCFHPSSGINLIAMRDLQRSAGGLRRPTTLPTGSSILITVRGDMSATLPTTFSLAK